MFGSFFFQRFRSPPGSADYFSSCCSFTKTKLYTKGLWGESGNGANDQNVFLWWKKWQDLV